MFIFHLKIDFLIKVIYSLIISIVIRENCFKKNHQIVLINQISRLVHKSQLSIFESVATLWQIRMAENVISHLFTVIRYVFRL